MTLRHYGREEGAEDPELSAAVMAAAGRMPEIGVPDTELGNLFEAWAKANIRQRIDTSSYLIAWKAYEAGFKAAEGRAAAARKAGPAPTFQPVTSESVAPMWTEQKGQMVALSDTQSRTMVAALAYFADMVLAMGMGGEDLLEESEARKLLKTLMEG